MVTWLDPQAGAVSRIRRRIFVYRKSAEKFAASRIRERDTLPSFLHVKSAEKYVIRGLCASWIDVLNCWAGGEQQAL